MRNCGLEAGFSLALFGCAPVMMPHQKEATSLVWYQVYDEVEDPPSIEWISKLDCGKGHAFQIGTYLDDPNKTYECVYGVTWPEDDLIQLALFPGWTYSNSAFAHELYHAALFNDTGDGDPGHKNPGFGINWGYPYGIVDQATDKLAAQGL